MDRAPFTGIAPTDVETLNMAETCKADAAGRSVWFFTCSHPKENQEGGPLTTPAELGRVGFASLLLDAYALSQPMNTVLQFSVFLEMHSGEVPQPHLHAVVQTSRVARWGGVVGYLRRKRVRVHVSAGHRMYFSAFRYCVVPSARKPPNALDQTPLLSRGHQDPAIAAMKPPTADAVEARSVAADAEGAAKAPRLTKRVELAQAIVALGLRDAAAVDAYVNAEQRDGRTRLADFVLGLHDVNTFLERVWRMHNANATRARLAKSKLQILQDAAEKSACVCDGAWIPATIEVCERNDILPKGLAGAIRENLAEGPGKRLNIFLYGESNCGKSHLLNPLGEIFEVMPKPQADSTFGMENLPEYEVVVWHEMEEFGGAVQWGDILNWSDGAPFLLARKGVKNLRVKPTQPIFFSGGDRLSHPKNNRRQQVMMDNRIRYFHLFRPIPLGQIRRIAPCGRCFARWVLDL